MCAKHKGPLRSPHAWSCGERSRRGTGAGASVVDSIVVAIVRWHRHCGVWGCRYARFRGGLNGVGHGTALMALSWCKWDYGVGSERVGWNWTGWRHGYVVAQVGLWEVVEEGETGLGRAGPPVRLSSLPSCGGISVVVFVGVGRCRRHIVPLRHDGVDDDAAVVASSRQCRSRRACMVLQVCSKRVGIGRAATRARFAVALRWWCRRRRAQWLRNARASLEEEEQCPRFKSSAN